ncbi:hypothetical protein Trichorick_00625 [Candidatus Trichorickettsia mobilis]|jgi:hypothetical protein|uniref:CBU-0592-like domain-containing protein n=1 Tax=Candidatus Trichorickettsia mobilis TaxID=1346319 RepID=A0ABZ0URS3_9RICK|nr:hypothetical protein [Candidatus Trichorickettsia mobilis]WPY00739.1 hypothetical protein Trichorick_00625 [Candidatus Trichorickettsia mobilis]
MSIISDIVGIIGVVMVITVYLLLQMEKVQADSISYLVVNLVGSLLIVVSLIYNWNLSSFIIEVLWAMISIFGLIRIAYKKKNSINNHH